MFREFFRFDLRHHLRQPLLWAAGAPLAVMAFVTASSDTVHIGGAIGALHLNAPGVIAHQLTVLSILALLLVTAFIAGAVLRDSEVGMADLLFTTPTRKLDYLGGRFLAGLAACVLVFAVVTLAMMAGSLKPGIAPERTGPFALAPYAWSFGVFVLPNLLFVSALLMLLAATTRSMVMVYVGALAFLVLWSAASFLGQRPEGLTVGALLDPFGVRVLQLATRHLTPDEANTRLPALTGPLLANRLLWAALSLAMFAATVVLFKPQRAGTGRALWRRRGTTPTVAAAPAVPHLHVYRIAAAFTPRTAWVQCWRLLCFDTRGVLRSLPFVVMLMLALVNFGVNYTVGGLRFDSVPYPLTRLMLQELNDGINLLLVLVLLFFSGDLVHKDRQARIAMVTGALPVPGWVPLLAQCGALMAVVLAFLFTGVVAAIGIQLAKGGVALQPLLYVQGTLVAGAYFLLMAPALLALQVLASNRYGGYALGIALMASGPLLEGAGLTDRLYNFASLPPLTYSDMNGYGDGVAGWAWFAGYWALFATALLGVAQAFAVRGVAPSTRQRFTAAGRALRHHGAPLAAVLAAFAATGGWIFHNTHQLNTYTPPAAQLDARAAYEKAYREWLHKPVPRMTALRTEVDIHPERQAADIRAHYTLRNDTAAPIATLFFQADPATTTLVDRLPPHRVVRDDARFGVKLIELDTPLAPGASLALDCTVTVAPRGFTNSGAPGKVRANGTMFTLEDFFPKFSYDASQELDDNADRIGRALPPPERKPLLQDPQGRQHNYLKRYGVDAGLIDFEATLSTSADQVAIAPGTLQREWTQGGRRFFHYRMDTPILPFVSFQSGRWATRSARWQGVDITVFHDPQHGYNVDRMLAGAQAALAYNSAHFGPYPHKVLRIVETPLYDSHARSFPTTIPFSESLGFINDLRGAGALDHVFYVTAHEVAHQWWGDQAIAADVQGEGLITEGLAEYSALMTVAQAFGPDALRRILRFDLDSYLSGRGAERVGEQPLLRNEGQTYLAYRKASLALVRLQQALGEAAMNRALGRFMAAQRQDGTRAGPPYATSLDLLAALRAEAPPEQQALITDLFERIVVYDDRVLAATTRPRADGRWDVTLQLSLAKRQADAKGKETALPYDDPVDVAIYAANDRVLLRSRQRLGAGTSSLTLTVAEKPVAAGLDPDAVRINRTPGDARKAVSF